MKFIKYGLLIVIGYASYSYLTMNIKKVKEIKNIINSLKIKYPKLSDLNTDLTLGLIETESDFIQTAKSSVAYGYMQLRPSTYNWILDLNNISVSGSIYDAENNILAGMLFFKWLKTRLRGNIFNTIQAYNVGLSGLKKGRTAIQYATKVYTNSFKYLLV